MAAAKALELQVGSGTADVASLEHEGQERFFVHMDADHTASCMFMYVQEYTINGLPVMGVLPCAGYNCTEIRTQRAVTDANSSSSYCTYTSVLR